MGKRTVTGPSYAPPLDQLLKFGSIWAADEWPDYAAMGWRAEHIPELIRMATDPALLDAETPGDEIWAPAHAWRVLALFGAAEAAAPLAQLFRRMDDQLDDMLGDALPEAFGVLGPAAIPALADFLANPDNGPWARMSAALSLEEIGLRHAQARPACVAVLSGQLERYDEQDPALNGWLIAHLLELEAVETAPIMERAFAADQVDETAAGDWEDVQVAFGLKPRRERPRRPPPPGSTSAVLDRLVELLRQRQQPRQPTPRAEFEARAERALVAPKPKRKRHRKRKPGTG
jgi:hypothetical protein